MIFALLLLQAAAADPEQDRYGCQLAEHRLLTLSSEYQAMIARRIIDPKDMVEFQRKGRAILAPYVNDVRDSIRDGDPAWVCDQIAKQATETLTRDAIRPIFGGPP
jgi:predicted RNA-binding protein with PUA domain